MTQVRPRRIAKRKAPDTKATDALDSPHPRVRVLTEDEAWALYDAKARTNLGMSAEEFERAWAQGQFRGRQEERVILDLIMLQSPKPAHSA
jgi:hypothetical protein